MTEPSEAAKAKAVKLAGIPAFIDTDWQRSWPHALATFIQQVSDMAKRHATLKDEYDSLDAEHTRQRNGPSRGYDEEMALARMEDLTEQMEACFSPFILSEPVDPLAEALRASVGNPEQFAAKLRGNLAKQGYKIVKDET